jgi:hypothetical protein
LRVRQTSEDRLYWTIGRGELDNVLGIELVVDSNDHVRRTIFSRGKFGRESILFEEVYSAEEFLEILRAEKLLLGQKCSDSSAKALLLEAMDRLRRVYDGL